MALGFGPRKQRSFATDARLTVVALALLAGATPRAASTTSGLSATAVLGVTATVNANCIISTSAVSFGSYQSLQANATAPLNAVGTVSIACTKGSAPRITLDLGQNPNGDQRYMALAGGGGLADVLHYELYQPPSADPGVGCRFPGSVAWGSSAAQTFVPAAPHSRVARSYNVCGTIPPGQAVGMGSYADTVVATVSF